MKIVILMMIAYLASIPLSLVYAKTADNTSSNFTYHEIVADRMTQPLPGNYQCISSYSSDFELSYKIKRYTNKSGLLRFFLLEDGSFSRSTYNYCIANFSGDITLMTFGRYAKMSVNFKDVAMRNEYLQISIPFGSWNEYSKRKQVNK